VRRVGSYFDNALLSLTPTFLGKKQRDFVCAVSDINTFIALALPRVIEKTERIEGARSAVCSASATYFPYQRSKRAYMHME
jgi:hypothetical protein